MLIPWVIGWIQDVSAKHAASMGEMPSAQVAKETVQTLISKDRQSHGRKDVMLRYTMTMIAQCIAGFLNIMDDEPGFFHSVDPKGSGMKYIPINQTWTEQEYMFNLADLFELPPPQDDIEMQQYFEAIQQVRTLFEKENDVKAKTTPGFIVNEEEYSPDKMRKLLEKSLMTIEELQQVAQVQATEIKLYVVNDMTQDVNLKITYGVDNDDESDPKFIANRALMLNERQSMSRTDMLKDMGVQNPEQLIENADTEIQALNLAKAIASNPEIEAYVTQLLQSPEMQKSITALMTGASRGGAGSRSGKGGPKDKQLGKDKKQ